MATSAPSPTAQPLPPLPDLQSAAGTGGEPQGNQSAMAAIMSGIAPVKNGVDSINSACRQIVQSGAVPGSEQICAQIISLATSLLPMALQQAIQPGQGGGGGGGQGIQALGGAPPPPQGGASPAPGATQ